VEELFLLEESYREDDSTISEQASSEWGANIHPVASRLGIQRASFETSNALWELDVAHKTKRPKLKKQTRMESNDSLGTADLSHDRVKVVPVATTANFLQALGVTNSDGKPRPGKASKLRQIQKFVEIVSGLVDKATSGKQSPSHVSVVDMGCGRGYLTFALHDFLCQQYPAKVSCKGIDVRPKLVVEINDIARSLGETFDGLSFETGTIESFLLQSSFQPPFAQVDSQSTGDTCEVLIALHACDTATDDALWAGISRKAAVICVAPCCQKEVRRQIDAHFHKKMDHPMADVLRYGIYRERMTETVTDSMRALLLEIMGYDVNVFEFIGGEHTSKNVMITAVRKPLNLDNKNGTDALRSKLQSLANFYGVSQQKLASWIGEKLDDSIPMPPISRRGLPGV